MSEIQELDISNDFNELYKQIKNTRKKNNEIQELDISNDFNELYNQIQNVRNENIELSNNEIKLSNEEENIKNDLEYATFADEVFLETDKRQNLDNYDYKKKLSNRFTATYINDKKKEIVIAFKGTDFNQIWEQISENINPFKSNKEIMRIYNKYKGDIKNQPINQLVMDLQIFLGDRGKIGRFSGGLLEPVASLLMGLDGFLINTQNNIVNELDNLYPDYKKTFTGFSLGGALSRKMLSKNQENSRAITFNGATGITPGFDELFNCKSGNCNIKNYRIKNDIVSTTELGEGEFITLEPKESVLNENVDSYFPSHSLKHFINRKNYKKSSSFEIPDNPLIKSLTDFNDLDFDTFNEISPVLQSPQLFMGFLNGLYKFVKNNTNN